MAEIAFHIWIPIVAIACGVVVAGILYYKNKKQYFDKWLTIILFVLRTLVVAGVVMLLINPFLTIKTKSVERPLAIFLCDNSASITMSSDSSYYKKDFFSDLESLKSQLSARFDVEEYVFGDSLRKEGLHDYSDNTTNLSDPLSQLRRGYYKRNVGAVLLFSDGIVNTGYDLEQSASAFPFPIHCLVMGDTVHKPDMIVKSVRANRNVAVGTTFPIEAVLAAENAKGGTMTVSLAENGKTIAEKQIDVTSDKFAKEEVFLVTAREAGMHHYQITVSGIANETAQGNNIKSVFVDVKSQKYKVVLVAAAPHPDMAALQSVMREEYDMQVCCGNDVLPNLADADILVVFGTISNQHYNALVKELDRNKKLSVFFVQGDAVSVEQLNNLQKTFVFKENNAGTVLDVKPLYNSGFSLFTLRDGKKSSAFPPLSSTYLQIDTRQRCEVLFYQQVLDVQSTLPLLAFADDGRKTAFLFGSGIWRWRLYDYFRNRNHVFFDEIFLKTLKYLILENDKSLTLHYNEAYYGGADVVINAIVRNASDEIVTDAEVRLNVENMATGEKYEHDFYSKNEEYEVNLGQLPEGAYQFSASTMVGGRSLKQNGTFIVADAGIEAQYLTADVNALMQVASLTEGSCRNVREMGQLAQQLNDSTTISSIEHSETDYRDLISLKWIILLIIAAATIEWLLRKIFGTY